MNFVFRLGIFEFWEITWQSTVIRDIHPFEHLLLLPKKLKPVSNFGIILELCQKMFKTIIFKTITRYLMIVYVVFDSIWPNLTANDRKNDHSMVKAGLIRLLSISRCLTWIPNLIFGNVWSKSINYISISIKEDDFPFENHLEWPSQMPWTLIDCLQNKVKFLNFVWKLHFSALNSWLFDNLTHRLTFRQLHWTCKYYLKRKLVFNFWKFYFVEIFENFHLIKIVKIIIFDKYSNFWRDFYYSIFSDAKFFQPELSRTKMTSILDDWKYNIIEMMCNERMCNEFHISIASSWTF